MEKHVLACLEEARNDAMDQIYLDAACEQVRRSARFVMHAFYCVHRHLTGCMILNILAI